MLFVNNKTFLQSTSFLLVFAGKYHWRRTFYFAHRKQMTIKMNNTNSDSIHENSRENNFVFMYVADFKI